MLTRCCRVPRRSSDCTDSSRVSRVPWPGPSPDQRDETTVSRDSLRAQSPATMSAEPFSRSRAERRSTSLSETRSLKRATMMPRVSLRVPVSESVCLPGEGMSTHLSRATPACTAASAPKLVHPSTPHQVPACEASDKNARASCHDPCTEYAEPACSAPHGRSGVSSGAVGSARSLSRRGCISLMRCWRGEVVAAKPMPPYSNICSNKSS